MKKQAQDKCSFCGKTKDEVFLLISGIDSFICDSCAMQANLIVHEELQNKKKKPSEKKFQNTNTAGNKKLSR